MVTTMAWSVRTGGMGGSGAGWETGVWARRLPAARQEMRLRVRVTDLAILRRSPLEMNNDTAVVAGSGLLGLR
jgi:hypothetical protein